MYTHLLMLTHTRLLCREGLGVGLCTCMCVCVCEWLHLPLQTHAPSACLSCLETASGLRVQPPPWPLPAALGSVSELPAVTRCHTSLNGNDENNNMGQSERFWTDQYFTFHAGYYESRHNFRTIPWTWHLLSLFSRLPSSFIIVCFMCRPLAS